MGKVNMKDTDYYKSGKQAEHNRRISLKGAQISRERSQKRKDAYATSPNKCSLCDKDLEYDKRHNKYCGSSCAATANNSKRPKKESKPKPSKPRTQKTVNIKPKRLPRELIDFEFMKKLRIAKRDRRILDSVWEELGWDRKRERVILEQFGVCNHCGINEWQGKPITLEIDHINGDNKDHSRTNLEGLCPNCHSLTETWCGRNKRTENRRTHVTDEQRVQAYLETGNIRQALLKLGLVPKGGNYRFMKKALTQWGIEY